MNKTIEVHVSPSHDKLHDELISLLSDIKLCEGPAGVSATLRRHPEVRDFLRQYHKDVILDLEHEI